MEHSPSSPAPRSNKKLVWILGSLLALTLAAAVAMTLLWSQEKQHTQELSGDLQTVTEEYQSMHSDNPDALVSSSNEYKAEVGKFTLSLPSNYAIIREVDGGAEGGPATQLVVAPYDDQVIDNNWMQTFTIFAVPASNSGQTFDQWIQSNFEGQGAVAERQADITIDGVSARVYHLAGLNEYQMVFFERDGIYYYFNAADATDGSQSLKTMDVVVDGWKFN